MPYTLTIGFIWFALAAMIGLVLGWVLRSAPASRQVSRARKQVQHELEAEIADLRERAMTLGKAAEERDRLQAELELMKERNVAAPSEIKSDDELVIGTPQPVEVVSQEEGDERSDESAVKEHDRGVSQTLPDVELGSAVLGRRIAQDDLKAVVGIGPAIERLCHGVGIRTWWDLARAEQETLRSMLSDAGPRFGRHDPATWSEQAKRFAEGRWEEARSFEDAQAAERTR